MNFISRYKFFDIKYLIYLMLENYVSKFKIYNDNHIININQRFKEIFFNKRNLNLLLFYDIIQYNIDEFIFNENYNLFFNEYIIDKLYIEDYFKIEIINNKENNK